MIYWIGSDSERSEKMKKKTITQRNSNIAVELREYSASEENLWKQLVHISQ